MTPPTTDTLAAALAQAHAGRTAIDVADWAAAVATPEDAYAVQAQVDRTRHAGSGPRHWKSGGGSRDAALTHALLPGPAVRRSPADLSDLHFFTPGVEAEVALRLGGDVTPAQAAALGNGDAEALIDAIAVSIEVVDSRWRDPGAAPALLKLADTLSNGALAVGDWQPYRKRDWAAQRGTVQIDGRAPRAFAGTHPLGDPAWLLPAWLRHATRDGATVPAGTVVTTGSWVGLVPVARGEAVVVRFDGIGEARVRV